MLQFIAFQGMNMYNFLETLCLAGMEYQYAVWDADG